MDEPIYIKQCREPKTVEQRDAWFKKHADEARACGVTWCRFSFHPDDDNRVIIEGWRLRPRREGSIRWQVSDREPTPPSKPSVSVSKTIVA